MEVKRFDVLVLDLIHMICELSVRVVKSLPTCDYKAMNRKFIWYCGSCSLIQRDSKRRGCG